MIFRTRFRSDFYDWVVDWGFFVVYKDRGFEILVRGGSGTHRGLVAILH